jgi:hypothetical protein
MSQCGDEAMRQLDNVAMWQCGNESMWQLGNVAIIQCGNLFNLTK